MSLGKVASFLIFLFFAFCAGVSFSSTPKSEILFDAISLPHVCGESVCVGSYNARIGNTGANRATGVFALIDKGEATRFALEPKVTDEGKVPRKFSSEQTEDGVRISLGELEPAEWLDLRFSLSFPSEKELLAADEVISQVGFDQGAGKPGSPTGTRFLRALKQMIDLVL